MKVFKRLLLIAGAATAAISLSSAASGAVIISAFLGGPFSANNNVGTLPATILHSGNTYDFTFDLVPPIDGLSGTQVEAALVTFLGSIPEPIEYQVYEGTPTALDPQNGTLLGTSLTGPSPVVFGNWGPGSYFVNIRPLEITADGEVISGSFVTTPGGVPEPLAWSMMLLGVALIGGGLRVARRKDEMVPTTA
jgi:hypothetical protein